MARAGDADSGGIREEPVLSRIRTPSVRTILMMHICSDVTDPRALAEILERAERDLVARRHPDPYIGQFNIPSPRYTPLIPTHSSFLPWWYKMVCIHLPDS